MPRQRHAKNLTFNANDYPCVGDRLQAFSDAAIQLNEAGFNTYTTVNPVKPSFLGDLHNGLAVTDKDIACRRLIFIDLDRTGVLDGPATDQEVADAAIVAQQITAFLREELQIEPWRVMSGNGFHVYLPIDNLPNDAVSANCCQRLLHGLGDRFDTETIKVDRSVYNASRITKVPGTIARKGIETANRPFRMAHVL